MKELDQKLKPRLNPKLLLQEEADKLLLVLPLKLQLEQLDKNQLKLKLLNLLQLKQQLLVLLELAEVKVDQKLKLL